MSEGKSIATGSELTAETWADFVERLTYHCRGEGVQNHCTASAIFIVQARRFIYGISDDYTDRLAIIYDDCCWHSAEKYYNDSDEAFQSMLDEKAQDEYDEEFLDLETYQQYEIIGDLEEHTVTGWDERWEFVCAHFTLEAAEAFIKRKGHDYRAGLRVYVDAQTYAWEFEAIKNAIMDGKLRFTEK